MGLDQYMSGRKLLTSWTEGYKQREENGYAVEEIIVRLGYWRKHPNLHGFIVENFGPKDKDGQSIDDCNPINLDSEALKQLIGAITNDELQKTSGFFFGTSYTPEDGEAYETQKKEDLEVMGHCLQWLLLANTARDGWYSVEYRASW